MAKGNSSVRKQQCPTYRDSKALAEGFNMRWKLDVHGVLELGMLLLSMCVFPSGDVAHSSTHLKSDFLLVDINIHLQV